MRGWLLDTNVLSELRRPRPNAQVLAFVAAQPTARVFVSTVTLAEIRFGIERNLQQAANVQIAGRAANKGARNRRSPDWLHLQSQNESDKGDARHVNSLRGEVGASPGRSRCFLFRSRRFLFQGSAVQCQDEPL